MSKEAIDFAGGVCIVAFFLSMIISTLTTGILCLIQEPFQRVVGGALLSASITFLLFCSFSVLVWFKAKD